jgi:hypothetical protein
VINPLAFCEIPSNILFNGREIFQKERVDKGHQEDRQRNSTSIRETESLDGIEEALTTDVITEEDGKRGLNLVGPEQRRDSNQL